MSGSCTYPISAVKTKTGDIETGIAAITKEIGRLPYYAPSEEMDL